jgi:hypothetical protein
MKIKKIEKLCKDAGYIFLYDELGSCNEENGELEEPARQWMGDGYAVYPLDGMPYLAEREVCAIFDIDEKKRDKIVINHFENLPEYVSLADQMETDEPLEEIRFQMSLGDDELALFRDEGGRLVVIKAEYKKTIDNWKECQCFKRVSADGKPFVAVMSGCILRGLIGTYRINEQLVETLGVVYNAAGVAAEQEQMRV